MTVAELIEKLRELPPALPVVTMVDAGFVDAVNVYILRDVVTGTPGGRDIVIVE